MKLSDIFLLYIHGCVVLTVVLGRLFFFNILCNSLKATTHFVFSLSVSASINVWFLKPGGSSRDVVI